MSIYIYVCMYVYIYIYAYVQYSTESWYPHKELQWGPTSAFFNSTSIISGPPDETTLQEGLAHRHCPKSREPSIQGLGFRVQGSGFRV